MLDDDSSRPLPLKNVLGAARNLCARSIADNWNGTISQAIEADRVPTNWHPAQLLDDAARADAVLLAPTAPQNHRVVASDGSQIYADAHQISDCYLLHISAVDLRYGVAPAAQLNATPHFFHAALPDDAWHKASSQGAAILGRELIDARRHIAELDELARLLETSNVEEIAGKRAISLNGIAPNGIATSETATQKIATNEIATLGLGDGIFDLRVSSQHAWRDWAQSENDRVLDRLRACGQPICGYIAASRATDVVTALRVLASEWESETAASAEMASLSDTRLFNELLPRGARSTTFVSRRNFASSTRNGAPNTSRHQTAFFYLKIDESDVARLEFPIWVTERAEWLDRMHALVLAQVEKGDGYPIAAMEAHEHAVVRGEEREMFYALLEDLMMKRGLSPRRSSKSRSKSRPLV